MSDQCKVGSIVDIANALQRAGQIMSGEIQLEEQSAMTIDELRIAKHSLQKDIEALIDKFQREAGRGVWVYKIELGHMQTVGAAAPDVISVEVDVRFQ
jgi:hypothetical protein